MFQHPIQAPVQAVFFHHRKILPQQDIHGEVDPIVWTKFCLSLDGEAG
jgi:hypothetical protein